MDTNRNIFTPPVPRDQSGPTESELIPFKSTKINVFKSKILIPFLLIALTVTALFTTRGDPMLFVKIVGWIGVVSIFFVVYQYSAVQKEIWYYLIPALIAWVLLQNFVIYATIFRNVLPGDIGALGDDAGFIRSFVAYFFGAGLCEEGLKATPILLALILTLRKPNLRTAPVPGFMEIVRGKVPMSSLLSGLALRGPLDGMLMGAAAGAAFIIDETLGEYVVTAYTKMTNAGGDMFAAGYAALSLVVPRVLQGVSGHMAWAAITGYFLGLGALYPKRALQLGLTGYVVAAVLHGLWDSVGTLPFPTFWFVCDSAVTVALFSACLLKAKQLQMASGSISASGGSILVGGSDREIPAPPAGDAQVVATAAAPEAKAGGMLAGLQGLASSLEQVAGGLIKPVAATPEAAVATATATSAAPAAAPATCTPTPSAPVPAPSAPATVPERFAIGSAIARYALEPGHAIDFGALFGSEGAPAGASGEIARHPTQPNVLGLKNTGASAWTAVTPDGANVSVPPGRSLKLAAGSRLLFGPLTLDIASY